MESNSLSGSSKKAISIAKGGIFIPPAAIVLWFLNWVKKILL
jgi:hypothetical protein